MTREQTAALDDLVTKVRAPYELTAHGRKPRKFSELSHFKANEYFNYLFFFCPVLFRGLLDVGNLAYKSLLRLSIGIRILLVSNQEEQVAKAKHLLDQFCRDAPLFFGTDKCETINLHSIRHLADQVKRCGPLYVSSAMSFESAHSFLARMASGTHDFCEIICRRYLEKQALLVENIEHDAIRAITINWTGQFFNQSDEKTSFFDRFLKKTDLVEAARMLYPDCKILSRASVRNVVYDSSCYQKNGGGCNNFVKYPTANSFEFGRIEYFITFADSSTVFAFVSVFKVVEKSLSKDLILRDNWFSRVVQTNRTTFIRTDGIEKLACIENETEIWLAKLPPFMDHK